MAKTKSEAEDLLTTIEQQEQYVQQCEAEMTRRKEALKETKEGYEQAVYDLRKLCRTRDEVHPILDGTEAE